MPKVTINEIDSSRYVALQEDAPLTVLVPGTASFGPVFSEEDPTVYEFIGESSLTDFYNTFGYTPAGNYTVDTNGIPVAGSFSNFAGDSTFEYVTNLLRSGAGVQFYRVNDGEVAKYVSDTSAKPEITISAKYPGSFGNYILVQFTKLDSNEDTLITIYRKSNFNADITSFDAARRLPVIVDETRISANENSRYFINSIDLPVDIDKDSLLKIIENLKNNASDSDVASYAFYNLTGGLDSKDGSNITEVVKGSYAQFKDPYLFNFDFVLSGGLINMFDAGDLSNVSALHKAMIDLCTTRGDCLAILDVPENTTASGLIDYVTSATDLNSSFAAMYAPWCSFVSATSGKTIMMASSLIFLKAILNGMQNQVEPELWYIPAGVTRASAPFIVSPKYEIGTTVLDKFQNVNNRIKINPIMKLRNYGYCIYGNSTTLRPKQGESPSALESLNVRIISNIIKKYIFDICCGLSFEYNNSSLWLKFYSQMDEKLLYMKRHYGLYDYKIQMDASTVTRNAMNERRVPGKVLISPTLGGEFFDIDFEIVPSGVIFGEEAQ